MAWIGCTDDLGPEAFWSEVAAGIERAQEPEGILGAEVVEVPSEVAPHLDVARRLGEIGTAAAIVIDDLHLADFLLDEVIANQSDDVQAFLMVTAAVESFDGPMCTALLEGDGAAALLEQVRSANLFVVELGGRPPAFRYHHLFQDFLRLRMRRTDPEGFAVVHRRAADELLRRGDAAGAIRHLLIGGEVERARAVLGERISMSLSDHGEMAGSHGLRQKANLVYDENFHVPLIISHPDQRGAGPATSPSMASAVDLEPTLLAIAGADQAEVAERHPALHGRSLLPAMEGAAVREGVLTAVESITTLDAGFWRRFGEDDVPAKIASGELRPNWEHRGFLRGYPDDRCSFGRYFAALEPNRPATLTELRDRNDVVLYDRVEDPGETTNLATDPANDALVDEYRAKLEALITREIGADDAPWVTERPNLLGWPTWRGDQG